MIKQRASLQEADCADGDDRPLTGACIILKKSDTSNLSTLISGCERRGDEIVYTVDTVELPAKYMAAYKDAPCIVRKELVTALKQNFNNEAIHLVNEAAAFASIAHTANKFKSRPGMSTLTLDSVLEAAFNSIRGQFNTLPSKVCAFSRLANIVAVSGLSHA